MEPVPTPEPQPWYKRVNPHWLGWVLTVLLTAATSYLATRGVRLPPAPPPPDEPLFYRPAGYATGWLDDRDAAASYSGTVPLFAATAAGQEAFAADAEAFLWQPVRAAWGRYAGPAKTAAAYPNVNQLDVGCCVGCGFKHSEDALLAVQQETEKKLSGWEPLAVECVYAESRVDVGGGQAGRGDGSNGSWAAKAAADFGNLTMKPYDGVDLSQFDPHRARAWGARGVPAGLKAEARKKVVKSVSRVASFDDFRKAVLQGYPVALCSNIGFNKPGTPSNGVNPGRRDADGFVKAGGVWPHCMAGLGVQGGARPGGFILNSWGDDAHQGPLGAGGPPPAGFWADAAVIDRICKSGDCWALSGFSGFPARKLAWFSAAPRPLTHPFALAP